MREPLGNWRATIARRSLQAMTGIFLISGMFCHAQQDCAPTNHFLLSDYAGQTMFDSPMVEINPVNWYSDHQYTVSITTLKSLGDQTNLPNWGPPTIPGCSYMNVLLYTWPKYADTYNVGPIDTKVTVSNTTYVNPWLTTFTVDVGSVDPAEEDQLVIAIPNGWWRYYVPILIQPPPPPTPPSPPPTPPCPTPTMATIDPSTWIAGQTYPITIMGTGYTTPANATSNCFATQITVGVNTGSLTLSDVTVVDSTKITATVAPADADPDETATINMYGGPMNGSDDVVRAPGTARAMVGNAAPAANANNTSPAPSGAPFAATATAQIDNLKAVVTDTRDIMDGLVTVKLTAPTGTKGDLTLNFHGINGIYTQVFKNQTPGSPTLKLDLTSVPPDVYVKMQDGTWNASVPGTTSAQSVKVPTYTLSTFWTYFKKVRFTQYNVPNEIASDCIGAEVTAYTIDNSCTIKAITLKSDFVAAAWINGTGVSISNGILKNAAASGPALGSKQSLCKSTEFGGKVTWPAGAIGYTPVGKGAYGNTFKVVTAVTASCSIPLVNEQSAAMPVDNNLNPVSLSNVIPLSCQDRLNLAADTNTTKYSETVADKCQKCSDQSTFGTANGHVDSYTSSPDCHWSPNTFQDLGNFYTSDTMK